MSEMKQAAVISASPKTSGMISSTVFADMAAEAILAKGAAATQIDVRTAMKDGTCADAYTAMQDADALILVFPLYFFCLPGMLMRFLQDYAATAKPHQGQRVWCIVNCGFYEPEINDEAVRVVQSFCRHIGAAFRFGVTISCGSMLASMRSASFMKESAAALDAALSAIADDVLDSGTIPDTPIRIKANINRRFYYFMGSLGWKRMARKNGLKKKDLYRKVYQPPQ